MTEPLRYTSAASRWFESLPVGNGRIGGMVAAGPGGDRIHLSESTTWSGRPTRDDVAPDAGQALPRIRELLWAGDHRGAQELAGATMLGRPTAFGTHLPLPALVLGLGADLGGETTFGRTLDLDAGVAGARTCGDRGALEREVFASNPDQVLVATIRSALPFDVEVSYGTSPVPAAVTVEGADLVLTGGAREILHSDGTCGTDFQVRARVLADVPVTRLRSSGLRLAGAREVTVIVAIGTDWDGGDPRALAVAALEAAGTDAVGLRARHVADHAALFGRVVLDLGTEPAAAGLPTDERLNRFGAGFPDPGLIATYFQFGRYLTIAGSRADSPLPLALQGIWNDGRASSMPWTNDFHLDVNTEQNYWAAEPTNLAETHAPLARYVQRLAEAGRETAARLYGAPGWVAHTVSNAWAWTAPGWGLGWGLFQGGGTWMALHLWEHYEYTLDEDYLREVAYPVLRSAAEFCLHHLVEHPTRGLLVTGPSESPENWYLAPDGSICGISMGPTFDRVLVEATLRNFLDAGAALGLPEGELEAAARAARGRLAPFQIGRHGQLQEWLEDYEEAEPSHRHTAHLGALFPEKQITPRTTPELARACAVTIERRQAAPDWEQVEWVEANFACYAARLGDGALAERHLRALIRDTSETNLMTYSAGGIASAEENIYSFDGNGGGTAAVAEMLVQSTLGEIELLPALPPAWSAGSVSGLRARGAVTVDVAWAAGRLARAVLVADGDRTVDVRIGSRVRLVHLPAGTPVTIEP